MGAVINAMPQRDVLLGGHDHGQSLTTTPVTRIRASRIKLRRHLGPIPDGLSHRTPLSGCVGEAPPSWDFP